MIAHETPEDKAYPAPVARTAYLCTVDLDRKITLPREVPIGAQVVVTIISIPESYYRLQENEGERLLTLDDEDLAEVEDAVYLTDWYRKHPEKRIPWSKIKEDMAREEAERNAKVQATESENEVDDEL